MIVEINWVYDGKMKEIENLLSSNLSFQNTIGMGLKQKICLNAQNGEAQWANTNHIIFSSRFGFVVLREPNESCITIIGEPLWILQILGALSAFVEISVARVNKLVMDCISSIKKEEGGQ